MPAPSGRPVLPCLQVVTDLNDEWHAMWLDGSTIYQRAFESRNQAVGFIQDLLAGRHEMCSDVAQLDFAKRRQIDPRVLANCMLAMQRSHCEWGRPSARTAGRLSLPHMLRPLLI